MSIESIESPGFLLQEKPPIYVTALLGKWLLKRTTPSWRIKSPDKGFQRIVRENRARAIALTVLMQQRTFPNSIVLATDESKFSIKGGYLEIPASTKFLVVDGQHRLWAQNFCEYEAQYACVIHTDFTEVEMAKLFLEINDNQKRVPSSLRWDLVRLVRPEDDLSAIAAADMVLVLVEDDESPLYQRIDLTGEQIEIQLKQGSLAPALKQLLSKKSPLFKYSFDEQYHVLLQYLIALKEFDGDNWGKPDSKIYGARVLRAFLRFLPDIIRDSSVSPTELKSSDFYNYLKKIDQNSLDPEKIRSVQGSAGIKAIYVQIYKQVFEN